MILSPQKPSHLRAWAAFSLLLGVFVTYISIREPQKFTARDVLVNVVGNVSSSEFTRYGLDFTFEGDPRVFYFARKSGEIESVAAALKDSGNQPISLAIDPQPRQGSSGPPFYVVLDIRSANGPLRTYDEVQESWRTDSYYGLATGVFMFLGALALEWCARRKAI